MKIENSDISFLSSHKKQHEVQESETLEKWDSPEEAPERLQQRDRLVLSDKFQSLHKSKEALSLENEFGDTTLSPKLMSIIRALEALTGKKIDMSRFKQIGANDVKDIKADKAPELNDGPERVGWGVNYNYERTEIREESLKFSAKGNVKTEDGKSIDFSLAISMKNRSEIHESINFKAGDALIDPLVLNFGADTVSISSVKHEFDLDIDGKNDEFSFVGSGSGFLALDKNSDGVINDGSELFGPTKGNGFNELKAYDSDNNNWIDENDDIFESLVIWTKDESGEENLFSLKDKNVGALYLGSANTQFDLNDGSGNTQAVMREESSIYLKENGGVGTLQEVDLKI